MILLMNRNTLKHLDIRPIEEHLFMYINMYLQTFDACYMCNMCRSNSIIFQKMTLQILYILLKLKYDGVFTSLVTNDINIFTLKTTPAIFLSLFLYIKTYHQRIDDLMRKVFHKRQKKYN